MKVRHFVLGTAILFLGITYSCTKKNNSSVENITEGSILQSKVDSVLGLMTLEEKIGQLNQYNGFWDITGPVPKEGDAQRKYEDIKNGRVGSMLNVHSVKEVRKVQQIAVDSSRLGIPLIFGLDVIHGYQTMMPIPLAESCSWDPEIVKLSSQVAAAEASAAGINWTFAPMVDINRDARWGRVMEGAGEDPYLGSVLAAARVEGFQGDLSKQNTIAACAKHFAGYGFAEAGRDYNTVDVSQSTLHNIILPPFKAANDAGVATFMNGFNELGGVAVTGSEYLQREILKEKWGFEGFVVSDWGSIPEIVKHGMAKDKKHAAEIAFNAGSDMDMEGFCYLPFLEELIQEGKVDESKINDAVKRILKVKFELGLFDDPYLYCNNELEKAVLGSTSNLDASLKIAKESIVLLKNEGGLLPLNANQKIALIGPLADDKNSPLGNWRAKAITNSAVSLKEGIEQILGNEIPFEKGCVFGTGEEHFVFEFNYNKTDLTGIEEAVNLAKNSDVVIMALGEHGFQSGEGRSRSEIGIPGVQLELLKAVFEVNKNIVLVLSNGRPLTLEWESENIPAIVETWHLGSQSGNAIASVLFGEHNPSGKLSCSFPYKVGQLPIYYNHKNTGRIDQYENKELVFYSHYSDVSNDALYPFGHGLSYSNFKYGDVTVSSDSVNIDDEIIVSVKVKNSSEVDGAETVQLYIRDLVAKETRPVKELKDFKKVSLKAGEEVKVDFKLDKTSLGYFTSSGDFVTESGDFEVFVGGSSVEVKKTKITLL